MVKFRIEKDSLGEIKVESTKLWGAQTQRSIENFQIGIGKFHFQNVFIEALASVSYTHLTLPTLYSV